MSNALKRKKKPTFFTKKDTRIIFESRNTGRVVIKSYKDYLAIGYIVLHDKFGFGQKRMIRLEQTVNTYSEAAASDKNMGGKALAYALKDKYGVDVAETVNRVPQSQLMKLYARKGHCVEREAYRLASASMFNYMALTLTALKTNLKLTRNQLQEFVDKFIDYIDTLANYKQFQLTVPMIAETLADEIKFVCDLEV
mgnify:CR=1 FL=1